VGLSLKSPRFLSNRWGPPHSEAVQRLPSATQRSESRPSRIGPISLDMKRMGERNAGNPHVAFDVEGAGNVAQPTYFGLAGALVLDPTCERLGVKFPGPTRP